VERFDRDWSRFRDDSLVAPDGFPKGRSEDLPYTNSKVIVARSYVAQLSAPDDLSPTDHIGHGTAAAMIAAGVRNTGPAGTIVGVAPKAYLGNYKVFGSPGVNDFTTGQVLINALQDALNDYVQLPELRDRIDDYVVPATLGQEAGLYGALVLAERALVNNSRSK